MGASSPVPLESRVSTWIALVPRLLSHLNIRHVALASHSAGMIYLLNTLHHCRDLLHPEKPYVAFLGPSPPSSPSPCLYLQYTFINTDQPRG